MAGCSSPAQRILFVISFKTGSGFTVIVKVLVVPLQPSADFGVTVIVAVIGVPVLLVAVKDGIFPVPFADSPIAILLFVQVQVPAFTLLPLKVMASCSSPAQRVLFVISFKIGDGFTVIVKVFDVPLQPAADFGVTVIVAVIGTLVLLVTEKDAIFPVPLAGSPIAVLLFIHVQVVALTLLPLKVIAGCISSAQRVLSVILSKIGSGFTVIVKVFDVPLQPAADFGITVIVAVIGAPVLLITGKDAIFPVPLAGSPIAVLLFVHVQFSAYKLLPLKLIADCSSPTQRVLFVISFKTGNGFTVIVKVLMAPLQPAADFGITVIVAVIGTLVLLVTGKDAIFPVPLAGSPIAVLLFIHVQVVALTLLPLKVMADCVSPAQRVLFVISFKIGDGFAIIVKVFDVPLQPAADFGITVIVAVIGASVLLVTGKDAIFPVPLPSSPIAVLLFVHVQVVAFTLLPLKVMAACVSPAQRVLSVILSKTGSGFTVIVKILAVPLQPADDFGITVIVAVIGALVLLVTGKDNIFPVPLIGSPIAALLFVHVQAVALTLLPLKLMVGCVSPAQRVLFVISFKTGNGFTVIVNVFDVPLQPAADFGVTVIVAVIGALVLLVTGKDAMFPVPLAGSPIAVLLFVHVQFSAYTLLPLKVMTDCSSPAQMVLFVILSKTGNGFTVIVKVLLIPLQPAADFGITVIVAVIGAPVLLVAGKDAIFPAPLP